MTHGRTFPARQLTLELLSVMGHWALRTLNEAADGAFTAYRIKIEATDREIDLVFYNEEEGVAVVVEFYNHRNHDAICNIVEKETMLQKS